MNRPVAVLWCAIIIVVIVAGGFVVFGSLLPVGSNSRDVSGWAQAAIATIALLSGPLSVWLERASVEAQTLKARLSVTISRDPANTMYAPQKLRARVNFEAADKSERLVAEIKVKSDGAILANHEAPDEVSKKLRLRLHVRNPDLPTQYSCDFEIHGRDGDAGTLIELLIRREADSKLLTRRTWIAQLP